MHKTDSEILLEARDLIADGWCQWKSLEKDSERRTTGHCLVGAITACVQRDGVQFFNVYPVAQRLVSDYIRPVVGMGVVSWNDHPDRTQAQVIGALDDAARLAKEAGR